MHYAAGKEHIFTGTLGCPWKWEANEVQTPIKEYRLMFVMLMLC